MDSTKDKTTAAVIGLGYVGLPLALALSRSFRTIGFDVSERKIKAYQGGTDPTGEMGREKFEQAKGAVFTTDEKLLKEADFIVIAVPTPVDQARQPDLGAVIGATEAAGRNLKPGAIVVYESTVYPGVTEEVCVPILERVSGLKCGPGFKVGYSPERINPGDQEHSLERIVKVVSGQDAESLEKIAWLYGHVTQAGVYKAATIKVAEASKVIENTQRDLNIALMNELAIIFHKMDIDTDDVLKTAATKWNFLKFKPGLVGGHCIGVDPYYLTHKAEVLGYHPQVILAGRRINDGMGKYIAEQTVKRMIATGRTVLGARVLVMGLTFKENCSDLRNSRVIDVIRELESFGAKPMVWDPIADPAEAEHEYGVQLLKFDEIHQIDAVVAAVAHREIVATDLEILAKRGRPETPFMDVKAAFDRQALKNAGFEAWRL